MGSATYPPTTGASGSIKSVQRGLAAAAGTVTITSVDITKSFVTVFGTASSGSCAVSGTRSGYSGSIDFPASGSSSGQYSAGSSINLSSATISGGTTNLIAGVVQGYLNSSTQLIVSGACRWEVVEMN